MQTIKVHVFYGAQYMGNETNVNNISRIPDGAFIKINDKWYTMFHSSLSPVNLSDLPPEVTAQLCLLGETK